MFIFITNHNEFINFPDSIKVEGENGWVFFANKP